MLPRLEDYFGLPYPFGKLDQIGVPDFEAGAMENAGAVTFREVALLLDPATAPLAVQKRVAEVITHELAHQWFGNLVTMVWWDDLWLNEAFATWMAYKIVDALAARRGASGWTSRSARARRWCWTRCMSAHPIRADVNNAEEAGESFDAITYEKGGAVLRMIEGFLGEDRFRDGIRLYMRRHREANATADDLWGALARGVGAADRRAGQRLDPSDRLSAGRRSALRRAGARRDRDRCASAASSPTRARAAPSGDHDALAGADGAALPRRARRQGAGRCCCERRRADGDAGRPRAPCAWCIGNAEARGLLPRPPTTTRRCAPPAARAVGELRPAERMALVSDQWALVRADAGADRARSSTWSASLRDEEDHVVLDEIVSRLAIIEHRHLADGDRDALPARS